MSKLYSIYTTEYTSEKKKKKNEGYTLDKSHKPVKREKLEIKMYTFIYYIISGKINVW